jgi:hypothetical protein
VSLKYIFLPGLNDNIADIDGFIKFCGEIKPHEVYFSTDSTNGFTGQGLPDDTLAIINGCIDRIQNLGLPVKIWETFTPSDRKRLNIA